MNYKEVAKGLSKKEAARYASGIEVVHDMVDSLQRQGLLPKRFAQLVENTTSQVEQPFYTIPEGVGVRSTLEIGGKSAEQLETEVKAIGRKVTIYALDMLHSPKFEVLKEVTPQELLKTPVRAFGIPGNPTTRELLERIPLCGYGEYALELPRAEVGPHMAIADKDQVKDDYYYVMHQPISDRSGNPRVFKVVHDSYGRFLYGKWVSSDYRWYPGDLLVVALRKIESHHN